MTQPRAAILAVGSELLSGQVTNRNAAWIAQRLARHGIDTARHLVVDDVESEIVKGLAAAAEAASLVFVTGGLGPTSDDLTRQSVAKWCGEELTYDAASWDHIVERFARMSRSVPETNRQQCYFPRSAKVLSNRAGTANGFQLKNGAADVWVLPGPPVEVEAVWVDHIEAEIAGRIPEADRKTLRMWRTIGRGESHLAEIIEPLIKAHAAASNAPHGLEVAYRAHMPYIELKLRYPEREAARFAPLCSAVSSALAQWLFETDEQDILKELAVRLSEFGLVEVYDGVTHGHLTELLAPSLRSLGKSEAGVSLSTSFESHDSPKAVLADWLENGTEADVALGLAGFDQEGRWAIGIRLGGERSVVEHASPYKGDAMRSRNRQAIAWLAAKAWLTLMAQALH